MEDLQYSDFLRQYDPRRMVYIGSGGFAKVHKVYDHANGRYVALKIADVRPELKKFTLKNEVELVNRLRDHPNIARYDYCYRFDTGHNGTQDFAILQYYEEGNLKKFLNEHRNDLDYEDKKHIIRGVLNGIKFLHSQNVIHRDLKSENILIQREHGMWTPKITDFGLSREVLNRETITNSSIGVSIAYAAPEQIQHQKILMNVDLWAAGVIIYYVMTGELPFQGRRGGDEKSSQSQLEISKKIISLDLPQKLNSIPEPFQEMIRKCLVLNPRNRVQEAQELIDMMIREDVDTPNIADTIIVNPPPPPGPPYDIREISYGGPNDNPTVLNPLPTKESKPKPPESVHEYTPPASGDRQEVAWGWVVAVCLLLAIAGGSYYFLNNSDGIISPVGPATVELPVERERYESMETKMTSPGSSKRYLLTMIDQLSELKNGEEQAENYRPAYLLAVAYGRLHTLSKTRNEKSELHQRTVNELRWAVNTANIGGDHEKMRADFNDNLLSVFTFLSLEEKRDIPSLLN